MEAFRYYGRLPAAVAGVLGIALAVCAMPASAAERTGGGDYILASPALSIDNVSQSEGNAGGSAFTFTVCMSKLSAGDVKVNVQTTDATATEANNDYVGVSQTVTIVSGTLCTTVDVLVLGDVILEQNETFEVNLSNPVGATIADGQGIGTILNDDVSPCLSIKDVAVLEGDAGKSLAIFKVVLSNPSDQVVTVNYITADNTATIADNDYQFTSGTLTFPAKSTASQDIAVPINGDITVEPDQTFKVILSGAVSATLCNGVNEGIGTIICDECPPTATLVSQFAVEAVEEGMELRWQFGDPASIKTSWMERADAPTGPWATVEAEVSTVDGMLTMIDRSVEAEHTYYYRLGAELTDGQMLRSGFISATTAELVREFALTRISPNPTNGPARIDYALPQQSKVRLTVLDVQGRVVAVLVDGEVKAGRHQAVWSGEMTRGMARAGMYFIRFEGGGKSFVKRLALTQ